MSNEASRGNGVRKTENLGAGVPETVLWNVILLDRVSLEIGLRLEILLASVFWVLGLQARAKYQV